MSITRVLLFLVAAVLVLYALKVWLLYAEVSVYSFPDGFGGDDSPATSDSEDLLAANFSAEYLSASETYRKGEYEQAWEIAKRCNPEDAACLGLLAEFTLVGLGTQRNLTEAVALFTEAATRGDANSQYALGALYWNLFEGDPAEMRRKEALGILHLYAASVAGHPGAVMAMGYRHLEGYGVPKSCNTAALNYIEVARRVADVYSAGMPQAVELIRLGVDGKDRKTMSASEVNLFIEIASSGDKEIAAAVGKRHLLGIDGFKQSYKTALHHLQIAADRSHGGANALLGYMYCLGLGVEKSLDVAYSYFVQAAAKDESLGHNGLGYIYFHGTKVHEPNVEKAFKHFNDSAYLASADGMFNLGSMYLTGTGTPVSFQKAAHWYTQALDRGHTPAAYTLAVMHLNGIGTVRNCKIAVDLLKKVCERGSWVSQKLQEAYHLQETQPNAAAWLFLRLAEAGHEVAQMNVAHLLDTHSAQLLFHGSDTTGTSEEAEARALGKIHAQRHYEMSAAQGNALSELRLGDFAYYGWGIRADDTAKDDWNNDDIDVLALAEEPVNFVHQEADPELSVVHYKRTSNMRITGEWMQPFVARASFNLGFMYQFGVGVARDAPLARRYYRRCSEVDPHGVQVPVTIMLAALAAQVSLLEMPSLQDFVSAVFNDMRTHMLAVLIVFLSVLLRTRDRLLQVRTPVVASLPGRATATDTVGVDEVAMNAAHDRDRIVPSDTTQGVTL